MTKPAPDAFRLLHQYAPNGLPARRTRRQRYAWCLRHPKRAWRTKGCRL